jgi:type IV secretion system protein VirD4
VSDYDIDPFAVMGLCAFGLVLFIGTVVGLFRLSSVRKLEKRIADQNAAALKMFIEAMPFGIARFALAAELALAKLLGPKGLRLGYDVQTDQVIRYAGENHVFVVAPPRSGKGRDVLIPMLLDKSFDKSVGCIDPRGQISSVCAAELERRGYEVYVLNPMKIFPDELGKWDATCNPMLALDPQSIRFKEDCQDFGWAIVPEAFGGNAKHFADGGRDLTSTAIMWHMTLAEKRRNFAAVRNLLSRSNGEVQAWAELLACTEETDPMIKEMLGALGGEDNKNQPELHSIFHEARQATNFISSRAIGPNLSGDSPFRYKFLKERKIAVFLVTGSSFDTLRPWIRLHVAAALRELMHGGRGKYEVVLMLDEFPQIIRGKFPLIDQAFSMGAGHGFQIVAACQSLAQLVQIYGNGYEDVLASSGVRIFFGEPISESVTVDYISRQCGNVTIVDQSMSEKPGGSDGSGWTHKPRPFLLPQEIRAMRGTFIAFIEGINGNYPVLGRRRSYRDIPEFKGHYDPDPNYANENEFQNQKA